MALRLLAFWPDRVPPDVSMHMKQARESCLWCIGVSRSPLTDDRS